MQKTYVSRPPSLESTLDEAVEEDADYTPAEIVVNSSRWNLSITGKDNRPVEITNRAGWPPLCRKVSDDWECGAHEPKPLKCRVNCASTEDSGWANQPPNDGGGSVHTSIGASVVVDLFRITKVGDVHKSPVVDQNLDD